MVEVYYVGELDLVILVDIYVFFKLISSIKFYFWLGWYCFFVRSD